MNILFIYVDVGTKHTPPVYYIGRERRANYNVASPRFIIRIPQFDTLVGWLAR